MTRTMGIPNSDDGDFDGCDRFKIRQITCRVQWRMVLIQWRESFSQLKEAEEEMSKGYYNYTETRQIRWGIGHLKRKLSGHS